MLVLQATPFTKATAVPMSTFQIHINDIDALIPLETSFLNKTSDGSPKPWEAQTWWLEIKMQPTESPVAQSPARLIEVIQNAPSATTTAPDASVTPRSRPNFLAQLDKTLTPSFCFNSNINSSSGP